MEYTTISKEISRTINTGDHTFIKLSNRVEIKLDPGDSVDTVEQQAYSDVRRFTANDIRRMREENLQAKKLKESTKNE